MTTASKTDGWPFSTASTSSGKTFSPPVLTHCDPRPKIEIVPSAATVAMSPVSSQRVPSISTNVRAVFSGSFQYPRAIGPLLATWPMTPEPGVTGRRLSSST